MIPSWKLPVKTNRFGQMTLIQDPYPMNKTAHFHLIHAGLRAPLKPHKLPNATWKKLMEMTTHPNTREIRADHSYKTVTVNWRF
jgi:hypothetical protein